MSVKASTWAWDQTVSGNAKLVLLALADHANDEGDCWPGIDAIALKTGFSRSTVKRLIKLLSDDDYIIVQPYFDPETGRQTSNLYSLNFSRREGFKLNRGGVQIEPGEGFTGEPGEGFKLTPPIMLNRKKEPSEGKRKNKQKEILLQNACEILDWICSKFGQRYQVADGQGKLTTEAKFIQQLVSQDYTVQDLKSVYARQAAKWRDDPTMRDHANPRTIFKPSNFSTYFNHLEDTNNAMS